MRSGSVEEKVRGAGISDRAENRGWRRRWTRRTAAAVTLLVYASTFRWMTASPAGTKKPPGGAAWTLASVGALVSLALFTLAAWGGVQVEAVVGMGRNCGRNRRSGGARAVWDRGFGDRIINVRRRG